MSAVVRAGYKQTEVGVIPEDWEVRRLIEVVDFLDGQRRPVKDTDRGKMRGDIPYYGASGVVDYVNDYLFDDELILLGEDGENILSRNCRLAFRVSGKIWVNNHAHVLKPKNDNQIGYLVEFLESLNYEQYNTGTAQPKLNKQVCSGLQVVVPPPSRTTRHRHRPVRCGCAAGQAGGPHCQKARPQNSHHAATPNRPNPPARV